MLEAKANSSGLATRELVSQRAGVKAILREFSVPMNGLGGILSIDIVGPRP